jgi:hypothetical protein
VGSALQAIVFGSEAIYSVLHFWRFAARQVVNRVETEVLVVLEGHDVLPKHPPGLPSKSLTDILRPGKAHICWVCVWKSENKEEVGCGTDQTRGQGPRTALPRTESNRASSPGLGPLQ